jgi:hypothetical protein
MDLGGLLFSGQILEGDISVSRSVSDRDDQTGSPSREPLTAASRGTVRWRWFSMGGVHVPHS